MMPVVLPTVHPCPCCDVGGLDFVPCPSRVAIDAAERRAELAEAHVTAVQETSTRDIEGARSARRELAAAQAEVVTLRAKVASLAGGIVLRGWWCICDSFNGCEREDRTECRSCGRAKAVRA